MGVTAAAVPVLLALELVFPTLFPSYLATGLHDLTYFIQTADLGGPMMVSAVVMACNGALYELLYGESPFEARFSRYVSILTVAAGGRISWPLASVPAALVHPEEHVAIKPSVFRQQAAWMAPSMRYDANPQPKVYQRFRSMAQTIFDRLTEAGLKPRDMLDVRHFIWTTLRPKGLTMLEDMRVKMGD